MNSVFEWIFGTVAGIRPDPMCPGYKHFIIGPKTGGPVTWAESSYESVHGKIVFGWKAENGTFSLHATIPPNTAATLFIPAKEAVAVTEGGRQTMDVPGIRLLRMEDGCAVYAVEAGEYRFASRF